MTINRTTTGFIVMGAMVAIAILTAIFLPHQTIEQTNIPNLEKLVPTHFAQWQAVDQNAMVLPTELPEELGVARLYRAYRNDAGDLIMMVIVYGAARGDTMRLHLPEICYVAQGYKVDQRKTGQAYYTSPPIDLVSLMANNGVRQELVTYWMRVSDYYVRSQVGQQLFFLKTSRDQRRDSALVRLSVAGNDRLYGQQVTQSFLHDFLEALPLEARHLLLAPDPLAPDPLTQTTLMRGEG